MKKYAIIVAGGSGTRFGSTLPKQFVPLGGVPVLMRTIKAFADYDRDINIVVALPSEHLTLWGDLCALRNFDVPHKVVEGGANRFESVRNALFAVNETECLVAVHDGARPLVSRQVIAAGFETAARCGTAIPTVPVTLYLLQSITPVTCDQPLSVAGVADDTIGHFFPSPVGIIPCNV